MEKKLKNFDISPIKGENNENKPIAYLTVCLDTEYLSDEKKNTYFIKDTHNDVNFSLKKDPFPAKSIIVKSELDDLENRKTEHEVYQDLDWKSTIKREEENFINNQYLIDHEEVHIKSEDDEESSDSRFKNHEVGHKLNDQIKIHQCPDCPYQSKRKGAVKKHSILHRKPEEIVWHRCTECPYKTIRKHDLKLHVVGHNETGQFEIFKCPHCHYGSPKKQILKRHILVHRRKNMPHLHCPEPECSYKTHDKEALKRHSLVHSNDKFFKCTQCSYQAKRLICLKVHQLKHESTDKWHACSQCPYRTINKSNLKLHVARKHANSDELGLYKCEQCPYKTDRKYSLNRHALSHNVDKAKWLRCTDCSYKTLRNSRFRQHQMLHQDNNVPSWHQYKAIHNDQLLKHPKNHKVPDQTNWLQCTKCSYRTPQINHLKAHQMLHNGVVEWFRCFDCPYKTNWKRSLEVHVQIHLRIKSNKNNP